MGELELTGRARRIHGKFVLISGNYTHPAVDFLNSIDPNSLEDVEEIPTGGDSCIYVGNGKTPKVDENPKPYTPSKGRLQTWSVGGISKRYLQQKGLCYYCKQPLEENFHVDHVEPRCKGGKNEPSNYVLACPECNTRKGGRTPDQVPDLGLTTEQIAQLRLL